MMTTLISPGWYSRSDSLSTLAQIPEKVCRWATIATPAYEFLVKVSRKIGLTVMFPRLSPYVIERSLHPSLPFILRLEAILLDPQVIFLSSPFLDGDRWEQLLDFLQWDSSFHAVIVEIVSQILDITKRSPKRRRNSPA
jgi:hypothetical protein